MTSGKDGTITSVLTDPRRRQSEALAGQGEAAARNGQSDKARELFAAAAAIEESVAREAPTSAVRARSAVAVAAVALWHRSGDLPRAKRVAYAFLSSDEGLTDGGRDDLERIVERCIIEPGLLKLDDDPGMVPVEIRLAGGRVGLGVAPEVSARRRREAFASLLRRTADLEASLPYRHRGESELERDDHIRLFEVPAIPGSYGIRLYVATGTQQRLASEQKVTPVAVVDRFLTLAEAAIERPDAIHEDLKGRPEYANAFLDGFAEIAPDGNEVASVACRSASWRVSSRAPLFEAEHRRQLRAAITAEHQRQPRAQEKVFEGTLVAVHLTRKSGDWIELETDEGKEPQFIMVNENRLRAKVASMRSSRADARIRVYAKYGTRQMRPVMTDVFPSHRRPVET